MMAGPSKITAGTLLPVSLIITFVFLAFQIGTSYSKMQNNTNDIIMLKSDSKDVLETLRSLEQRQIRMETSLEMLVK